MAVAQKCNISRDHNLSVRQGRDPTGLEAVLREGVLPSMASGARRPCAYTIVCTYEIVASIYSIVTVGESLDEFPIHEGAGSTISALVVGAQRI